MFPWWRWLCIRAPANQRLAGSEFPHRARRYRRGGSPFLFPSCRSCRFLKIFLYRGWGSNLPGWHWLYVRSKPISDRSVGLGFPHRERRHRLGDLGFRPWVIVAVNVWKDYDPRIGPYPSRVRRNYPSLVGRYPLWVALALRVPANERLAIDQEDWGFPRMRGGVDPGELVFGSRFFGVVVIRNDF